MPTRTSSTRTKRACCPRTKRRTRTRTKRSEPPVLLGLGANLGRPREQLLAALLTLSRRLGPLRVAGLWRSEPVSPIGQPPFLNSAVRLADAPPPERLLDLCHELELRAGRRRGPRWGPRPLDVDLLLYRDAVLRGPDLVVPHPRLAQRSFVLAPLAEIAPEAMIPTEGRTVAELWQALPPDRGLERALWVR